MLDDRLGKRFENKEMMILGGTLDIEVVRQKHLKSAYDTGFNIENRGFRS